MNKLWLMEEDTRPRLFWLEDEHGREVTECFSMGEIDDEIQRVERLGFTVVNKDEFEEYM